MNKTIIAIAGISAAGCLIAFYIWSSHNRYYIMTGSQGTAYEVDRKTGESWMLHRDRKVAQQEGEKSRHNEQEIPFVDASKITGNAGLLPSNSFWPGSAERKPSGIFSGTLYNGSDWTVTRVIVRIQAKDKDGTVRWLRDFSATLVPELRPLTTESFSLTVVDEQEIKEAAWNIKKLFGYKETHS
jgi:hypothetical protein